MREKSFEFEELEDETRRISADFAGDACPFDLGEEFDPVAQRNAFRAAKTATLLEREVSKPKEIPEYEGASDAECTTSLIMEGPSEILKELMEKTIIGPDPKETLEQELQVEQITVPSKIKQRPLTVKPFPEEVTPPALTVAQALELEELGAEEIEELGAREEEIPSLQYNSIPVILAP